MLVTYAATDVEGLSAPANAALFAYVAHVEAMPLASAVVTHAGHGILTAALSYGLPIVAVPNWGDQPVLPKHIQDKHAGIALDPKRSAPPSNAFSMSRTSRRTRNLQRDIADTVKEHRGLRY